MRTLALLALAAGAAAFRAPAGRLVRPRASRLPSTAAAIVAVATEAPPSEAAVLAPRAMMDGGVFTFNKVVIDSVYQVICLLYPVRGKPRDFARFYVLETVARVPYFAYLSVRHLKETFGARAEGDSERMRTHYAEADNELHHLLIMESLGGNSSAVDRSLAQTMAFFYYWYVVAVYSVSEQAAYHLSELIEDHAYNTYDKYLRDHGESLRAQPVPRIARKYYEEDNPFLFDLFCTVQEDNAPGGLGSGADGSGGGGGAGAHAGLSGLAASGCARERRPLETLYDVFVNVRDDEREHWKTLCNLVQFDDMQGTGAPVQSTRPLPSSEVTAQT